MIIDDRSRTILEFESAWWDQHQSPHDAAKEDAIRRELQMPPARFYQLLGRLVDDAGAIAAYPQLCNRLRRIRDAKNAARESAMNLTPSAPTERNHP